MDKPKVNTQLALYAAMAAASGQFPASARGMITGMANPSITKPVFVHPKNRPANTHGPNRKARRAMAARIARGELRFNEEGKVYET